MKKINTIIVSFMFSLVLLFSPVLDSWNGQNIIVTEAHSGRTDSSGGHRDNKNKSGLGYYHYHCGGNPPHLHENGVCPYSSQSTSSNSSKKKTVKAVQEALNELGYDCGIADGIYGKKTKAALKEFQKNNDLTVDGIIGKQVKKALNID